MSAVTRPRFHYSLLWLALAHAPAIDAALAWPAGGFDDTGEPITAHSAGDVSRHSRALVGSPVAFENESNGTEVQP